MLYYLIEKYMQKFRHFWRKKNFTQKSHLRPSCNKPFNYRYCEITKFSIFWNVGHGSKKFLEFITGIT